MSEFDPEDAKLVTLAGALAILAVAGALGSERPRAQQSATLTGGCSLP